MSANLTENTHFTVVFSGALRNYERNPFHAQTPFGSPQSIAFGDHLADMDAVDSAWQALEWIASHDNAFLTDNSAATRACIDALVLRAKEALAYGSGGTGGDPSPPVIERESSRGARNPTPPVPLEGE